MLSSSCKCLAIGTGLIAFASQLAPAVTVTRGPYLQLQTPTSVSVVWYTDVSCTGEVEWGPTAGYGNLQQSAVSETRHEIAINGLSADSLYHYRVRCQGTPLTSDTTFRTAPPADATAVSFCFVGDSCSSPSNCTATYNAMLPQSANGFCVTLGDLAGRGEDNITDYWQSHFFTPAANFVKQICMYPTIGNHELYDETATYVYPARYLANWSLPTAASGSEFYYSFDKAHVHFATIDTFWTSYTAGSAQYNWLVGDLAGSTRPWKIVFGHDGPYISEDGNSNGSTTMRTHLVPVFEQYDVDLYLHGHYHNYQRNVVNGVNYIDQGTGGQTWSTKHADDSQPYVQAYADQQYSFTRLDIQGNRLLGRCIKTSNGTIIDGFQIDKPPITMPWQDAFPPSGPQLNWIAPWNFVSQCGLVARAGNPSGDGYVFQVADTSGNQYAYPMLANESMTNTAIEAQVYYDATTAVANRFGIGVRGRLFFDLNVRSHYVLMFVRNDAIGGNGHALLVHREAGVETVLADWTYPDVSGWHKMKLSAVGGELSAWIDGVLKMATPITHTSLAKGRPFVYNYRASGGAKTLVDDVVITEPVGPTIVTDFEGYADGTQVIFRQPSFSSSTSTHLTGTPNISRVITAPAFSGSKVYRPEWTFVDTDPKRWLRLTSSGTANIPNPTVDLTRPIRFRVRLNNPGSLRVCVGIRETGVDVPIGANGGTSGTIEWLGATSVVSGAPQGTPITVPTGQWQTLTFNPLTDPVAAFTGNGVLSAPNNKGVLEHVGFAVADTAGPFSVDLDLFDQPQSEPLLPPNITGHPADRQICPGTNTTFGVSATGDGILSYQWQKNGGNLSNGGHYSGVTTATLIVSNADANDAAAYRCVVTNAGGSTTSNQAALTLKAATTITQHPAAADICPGQPGVFAVSAAGDGTLSYQWQKDGGDITDGGRYSGATTPALSISGADGEDVGSYRCIVTAGCGTATSNAASLSLKAATTITQQPQSQAIDLGDSAVFSVAASGEGALIWQWQRNGEALAEGGHYAGVATPTLTVSNADAADAGNYRCVVTAGCGGVASAEAVLTVYLPLWMATDFNSDGDVDLIDFSSFQICFNGPNRPPVQSGCEIADFDHDGDVDLIDFSAFQSCFNGPNRPPACE